jgi:hypothetical protein
VRADAHRQLLLALPALLLRAVIHKHKSWPLCYGKTRAVQDV